MQKTVLYVDDEPSNLKALTRLFRKENFAFVTCDSPARALTDLDRIAPALVISDLRMPEMDGIQFLEQVRQHYPNCLRMMLTGYADIETVIEALNKGHVFRFIQKPWKDEELKAQVKAALDHQTFELSLGSILEDLAQEIIDNETALVNLHQFIDALSDGIEQPLMIIKGYVQLLKTQLPDDELSQKYLGNIAAQVGLMEEKATSMKSTTQNIDNVHPKTGA